MDIGVVIIIALFSVYVITGFILYVRARRTRPGKGQ
jgi:hypothetical protein